MAPAARATAAVSSVELLSKTWISASGSGAEALDHLRDGQRLVEAGNDGGDAQCGAAAARNKDGGQFGVGHGAALGRML
jgi:hypothetical protein